MSIEPKVTGRILQISAATRKRNPELFGGIKADVGTPEAHAIMVKGYAPEKPKTRIRQSSKPLMNKLESAFYNLIKSRYPNFPAVRIQAVTFKLANGLRYTPDFWVASWPVDGPARPTAWEVKGKWVDGDSFPKLKMAAAAWPEIAWILVWRDRQGRWQEQTILP